MTTTRDPEGKAPELPENPHAGRRRAAGIYGAIITASIMTAVGGSLPTLAVALSVLVTLAVYWLAANGQYFDRGGLWARDGRAEKPGATPSALASGTRWIRRKPRTRWVSARRLDTLMRWEPHRGNRLRR